MYHSFIEDLYIVFSSFLKLNRIEIYSIINKLRGYQSMAHNILRKMTETPMNESSAPRDLPDMPKPLLPMHSIDGAKIGWKDSGGEKGRGVFARTSFKKGDVIEIAPVIPVAATAVPEEGGAPDGYLLDWEPEEEGEEHCMPLGYIMLYNHSNKPNIDLEADTGEYTMTVFAARDIEIGEELCWNYSCEIWFDED